MENPIKKDDLEGKPPIFGNNHIGFRGLKFWAGKPHGAPGKFPDFSAVSGHLPPGGDVATHQRCRRIIRRRWCFSIGMSQKHVYIWEYSGIYTYIYIYARPYIYIYIPLPTNLWNCKKVFWPTDALTKWTIRKKQKKQSTKSAAAECRLKESMGLQQTFLLEGIHHSSFTDEVPCWMMFVGWMETFCFDTKVRWKMLSLWCQMASFCFFW